MTSLYKIAGACASLTIASATAASPAEAAARFADFPEARIDYYDLSADSATELRKEMNENGPADPRTGQRRDAYTRYHYNWRLRDTPDGACTVELRNSSVVNFPRLSATSKLSGQDRAKWNAYLVALEHHEAGHLARAAAVLPALRRALAGGSCEGAEHRARKLLDAMQAGQHAFDEESRHGLRGGARFP